MTKATRSNAAFFFILATLIAGSLMVGSMPAMAGNAYGCRGDQACEKIAAATQCDASCQRACKDQRFDYVTCYSVWGPKLVVRRSREKGGTK